MVNKYLVLETIIRVSMYTFGERDTLGHDFVCKNFNFMFRRKRIVCSWQIEDIDDVGV